MSTNWPKTGRPEDLNSSNQSSRSQRRFGNIEFCTKLRKKKNYPLHSPKFYKDTFADANKVIRSTWVSSKGNDVQRFEKKLSSLIKELYFLRSFFLR